MNAPEEVSTANLEYWAWCSIAVNVVLIGINVLVATLSNSLAVGAEVVHNGIDLISAIGVLVGIKLATRKTRAFPYGLYKLENVISVVVALLIFVTAYELARQAIFNVRQVTNISLWMFAALGCAAAIPALFSHWEMRAGRAANSPALIADAQEYRVHVMTTGVAFSALVAEYFHFPLDRVAAVLIILAIVKTGWDLLLEGVRVLLDASLAPDMLDQVRDAALEDPMVADVTSITGRNAGRFRFVEIILVLRGNDLEKADLAAHRVERRIREKLPNVERVLVHADPKPPRHVRCAVPLKTRQGVIANHFGSAPLFALVTMSRKHGEMAQTHTALLSNPHQEATRAKGIRVAEWLVEQKVDVVVLRNEPGEEGPGYVFGNAAVSLHSTATHTLSEALDEVSRTFFENSQ